VVVVSSQNHVLAKRIDWEDVTRPTATTLGLHEYNVSKLANVLFAKELGRRLDGQGVTTYSVHPGTVASDAWRRVPRPIRWLMKKTMLTNEEGARTSVNCATAPELATETGYYYSGLKRAKNNPTADDEALARELWERSEAWVSAYL